ncbi:unnamed protein product [Orchesella dallaii]|uniref:Uncharacterized protein n=1 Tax=Orchesella dallaii TaxID=48710 RepID=A0ABP1R923_9HEXA
MLVVSRHIFVWTQTIRFRLAGNLHIFHLSYAINIASGLLLISLSVAIVSSEEYLAILNGFVLFFNRNLPKTQEKLSKRLEKLVTIFSTCLIGTGFVVSLIAIISPKAPMMLGNVIPEKHFILPLRILVTIHTIHVLLVSYINMSINGSFVLSYSMAMKSFISQAFHPTSLKPCQIMQLFRTAQVLQCWFLDALGFCLIPVHFVATNLVVFCNYVLIRHHQDLKPSACLIMLLWSLLGGGFWSMVLEMGGYTHVQSKKTMNEWKLHDWGSKFDNRMMSKFRYIFISLFLQFLAIFILLACVVAISTEQLGDSNSRDSRAAEAIAVTGQFQYTYPDGKVQTVSYTADENGFHPSSTIM